MSNEDKNTTKPASATPAVPGGGTTQPTVAPKKSLLARFGSLWPRKKNPDEPERGSFDYFYAAALKSLKGQKVEAWSNAVAEFRRHLRTDPKQTSASADDMKAIWERAREASEVPGGGEKEWPTWDAAKKNRLVQMYSELLDLNIQGGLQHVPTPGARSRSKEYENTITREPDAPLLDQFVFATGSPGSDSRLLDPFVKNLVEGYTSDGVTFIAGVRGSGKSTTLNRILWFANNWLKGTPRPLWLRIDLGTAFDSKKFLLNFMQVLCNQARQHAHRPGAGYKSNLGPSFGSFVSFCWAAISAAGRWCDASRAWGIIALIICASLLGLDRATAPPEPKETFTTWEQLQAKMDVITNWPSDLKAAATLSQLSAFSTLTNLAHTAPSTANVTWIPVAGHWRSARILGARDSAETILQATQTLDYFFKTTQSNLLFSRPYDLAIKKLAEVVSYDPTDTFIPAIDQYSNYLALLNNTNNWPGLSNGTNFICVQSDRFHRWIIPNKQLWQTLSQQTNVTRWQDLYRFDLYPEPRIFPDPASAIAFQRLGSLTNLTRLAPLTLPRHERVFLRHVPEVSIAVFGAGILVVGFAHRRRIVRNDDSPGTQPGETWFVLFPVITFAVFLYCLGNLLTVGLRLWMPDRWILWVFIPPLVLMVFVAISCWRLPRHWNVYGDCYRTMLSLQRRDSPSAADLPWIDKFSGLAKSLFPAADETSALNDMDGPFLEEEVKRLLDKIAKAYGRVIILMDDVDAMPNNCFPDFVRLLRPLGKVRNVRCVVAVPRYFYEAYYQPDASDLHSTVTKVVMLADPYLFHGPDQGFKALDTRLAINTEDRLLNLCSTCLHVPFKTGGAKSAGEGKGGKVEGAPPFDFEQWDYFKFVKAMFQQKLDRIPALDTAAKAEYAIKHRTPPYKPIIQTFLDDFGPSRREFLREIRQWLEEPASRELFKPTYASDADLTEFKSKYLAREQALLCKSPAP